MLKKEHKYLFCAHQIVSCFVALVTLLVGFLVSNNMEVSYILLVLTAVVSFASNLASFRYIYLTYDLNLSLFYILALDSAFVSCMSFIGTLVFSYLAFAQPDSLSCSIAVLSSSGIALIQPFLMSIISLIRYNVKHL